jgi:PAS domain S-box-containing protein
LNFSRNKARAAQQSKLCNRRVTTGAGEIPSRPVEKPSFSNGYAKRFLDDPEKLVRLPAGGRCRQEALTSYRNSNMNNEKQYRFSQIPEIVMLCVALLVVFTTGLFSYSNIRDLQDAEEKLRVNRELRQQSANLLSAVKDAETGERGFLLTGRERYLEPYNKAISTIPELLARLRTLYASSPEQAASLARLERLTLAKLAELDESIRLRRSGREGEVRMILDSDQGKTLMDEVRVMGEDFGHAAEDRLVSFVAAENASATRLRSVSLLGSVILFVFLIISARVIRNGMAQRELLYKESDAAKSLLMTTLTSIADAVIATNAEARITFINPVAEELTGWRKEEALGRHITEVFPIVNETTQMKVGNPLETALAKGVAVELVRHTNLISRMGTQLPIDDSAAPLRDKHGSLVGAVLVFRDISARRHSERRLEDAVDALQRSNEELQQFVNGAAHDLRSPLAVIRNMTQLASLKFAEKLGDEGVALLAHIDKGVTRMTRFLDDLLSFAHASHFDASTAPLLSLDGVLAETLSNLSPEILESGATVTSDPLPEVRANTTHMTQLFQNLIGNALKYRSVQPCIHVSARQENRQWVVSVSDNGIGFDAAHAKRIFRPFQRLHGEKYPGSGIGLATCQKVVEGYGGIIWVESEPGQGSRFFFTLPITE